MAGILDASSFRLIPCWRSRWIASRSTGRRARRSPARTRSVIRERSSSAMAPTITMRARPSGPPCRSVPGSSRTLPPGDSTHPASAGSGERSGPASHRRPGQQRLELAPPGAGPRELVLIHLDDLQSPLLGQQAEVVQLGLGMLVRGRNPQIQGRAFRHTNRSSWQAASNSCTQLRLEHLCPYLCPVV